MDALALEIKQFNYDPDYILNNESNKKLLDVLVRFAETARRMNYDIRVCSKSSLQKLNLIPNEKKDQITLYFENWLMWIQPDNVDNTEMEIDSQKEKQILKRALAFYGMTIEDNFWTALEDDQLIEIYGQEMLQLYRSLSFFKYSGYSLLDLSVHEWFVLWERPHRVTEAMGDYAKKALSTYVSNEKFDVPNHVLREVYDTGKTEPFVPRAILMEFKNICSIRQVSTGAVAGFVCTSKAEIIAMGSEAYNIHFV